MEDLDLIRQEESESNEAQECQLRKKRLENRLQLLFHILLKRLAELLEAVNEKKRYGDHTKF